MKKRFLSLLLVAAMIFTMLPATSMTAFAADVTSGELTRADAALQLNAWLQLTAPDTANYFTDIGTCTQEQQTAINALAAAGIMNGTSETTFEPSSAATRLQLAIVLYNVLGGTTGETQYVFQDIPDGFAQQFDFLVTQGVLTADDADDAQNFRPDDPAAASDLTAWINNAETLFSRAELAVLVADWLGLTDTGTEDYFNDIAGCTETQQDAINALAAAGIVRGYMDGSYAPKRVASRIEAATVIYNAWLAANGSPDEANIPAQTIFADMSEGSASEVQLAALNLLVYQGILTSADAIDGNFLPNGAATEQAVRTWLGRVQSPYPTGSQITFKLLDANGDQVTTGYTVRWYHDAKLLGTGDSISVADSNAEYYYELLLSDALAENYTAARSGTVVPNGEQAEVTVTLRPITTVTVTGTVTDPQGAPISGAALTFTQHYTDTLTKTVNGTTDANGVFSVQIPNVMTILKAAYNGYYDNSMAISAAATDTTLALGDIALTKLPDSQVEVSVSLERAAASGANPATTQLTSFTDLQFTVYNATTGTTLTADDFTAQYPYLVFAQGVQAGDELVIGVTDNSGQSVPEGTATVTLDAQGYGSAALKLIENGSFVINSMNGADQAVILLFQKGTLYSASTGVLSYTSPAIPAGTYTMVLLERTELLRSVSSISELTELGLSSPTDYTVMDLTISQGVVTELASVNVPVLDRNKLS